ncbi:MAG: hypothetical protein EPN75_03655 [Beijerinckiaceae bacterium]|nr:MAG: hypothetical protein EPN75_03655 [Beijerinckiaceae bacterium]
MTLSQQDRDRIATAIRTAETKTSGEIVCVLARTSSDAAALPVFVASLVALAVPWVLIAVTEFSVERILLLQILVFLVLAALLCLPRVRMAVLPRKVRRASAHRAAMEQFVIRGIARKKDRCGILIFVSLAEHYARIIADEGIAARVPQSDWQAAVDALIVHMRGGSVAEGFLAAIGACEAVLTTHFPRTGAGRDELPDRIYLI